jgi:hypothetical protein
MSSFPPLGLWKLLIIMGCAGGLGLGGIIKSIFGQPQRGPDLIGIALFFLAGHAFIVAFTLGVRQKVLAGESGTSGKISLAIMMTFYAIVAVAVVVFD